MRIVIVNRYFWPETVLVNDISRWLAADGHEVVVLTGQPDYNPEAGFPDQPRREMRDGVEIRRIALFRDKGRGLARNLNSVLFILLAAFNVLFSRRVDAVWSSTIPPIFQALALRIVSRLRGAAFVYYPQDIYPEIATAMAMMKPGRLQKVLARVDTWTLDRADAVVTLSDDMAAVIRVRGANPPLMKVIRSFSPDEAERPPARPPAAGPKRFVFAGNLGRFQNLDALVEAFLAVDPQVAVLDFLGDGREKANLVAMVEKSGARHIRFHDYLPSRDAFDFVAGCDVGVISLSPEIYKYAFPAKTYTYLGAGLPVLALVERESELAALVEKRGIGLAVAFEEGAGAISEAIERLCAGHAGFRDRVYRDTDDLYRPERARREWLELFRSLADARAKG